MKTQDFGVSKLFDKHGRRIPPRNLQASVADVVRNHRMEQPKLNYADLLARIVKYLRFKESISADEFENRAETILEGLRADENTSAITNGVYLPFYLPQMQVNYYSRVLSKVFLPAVERSYESCSRRQAFYNFCQMLYEDISIAEGSRHERLVEVMQQGNVVGIYFPNCLQSFSIFASREQMEGLPEQFLLGGGFDTLAAIVANPYIFRRYNYHIPILGLSALVVHSWLAHNGSLGLYSGDLTLSFKYSEAYGSCDRCTSGLSVLG